MILHKWRVIMSKISYKRLFKKMIDLDMKNTELMKKAEVSRSTFYKMKNGENITTDVIVRICDSLNCGINEVMELVKDENN
jgi:putative conjugative transposon regulatory protein